MCLHTPNATAVLTNAFTIWLLCTAALQVNYSPQKTLHTFVPYLSRRYFSSVDCSSTANGSNALPVPTAAAHGADDGPAHTEKGGDNHLTEVWG